MTDALLLLPLDLSPRQLVCPAGATVEKLSGRTMGTFWSLAYTGTEDPLEIERLVQAELDAVVAEMSQWESGSELSRFNAAPAGSWHALSPGLFHVLRAGLALARHTDGAFDPTLGALTDLWSFGPVVPQMIPPTPEALAVARQRSGWRRITFDETGRRARQPGGLALDFSGIAKGHAVDRVACTLESHGLRSFLIEVGGELVARGIKPDREPWWVDCEAPPGTDLPPTRIALLDMAVATSGDYRRFLELDGQRRSHSLDPRTGEPLIDAPASVTVLHRECMIADALATAITVLGVAEGLVLAENAQAATIIYEYGSQGWQSHLSKLAQAMADA